MSSIEDIEYFYYEDILRGVLDPINEVPEPIQPWLEPVLGDGVSIESDTDSADGCVTLNLDEPIPLWDTNNYLNFTTSLASESSPAVPAKTFWPNSSLDVDGEDLCMSAGITRNVDGRSSAQPGSKRKRLPCEQEESKKRAKTGTAKSPRLSPGNACFVNYLLKGKFRPSLEYQLMSKHRLKPAPGVVLASCGGRKLDPQAHANSRGACIRVFEYNRRGELHLEVYRPSSSSASPPEPESFAAYVDEGKTQLHYPLVKCGILDQVPNACETCARQHLGRECEEFQAFLAEFKENGFSSAMEEYLPNWRQWHTELGTSPNDEEVPRVLAAIRAFHRTFKDDRKKIDKISSDSLRYFKEKRSGGKHKGDKIRWVDKVAPHRRCRVVDADGNRCRCGETRNKLKFAFGRHGGKHSFR